MGMWTEPVVETPFDTVCYECVRSVNLLNDQELGIDAAKGLAGAVEKLQGGPGVFTKGRSRRA